MKQLLIVLILMSAASFTYANDNRERVNQTLRVVGQVIFIRDRGKGWTYHPKTRNVYFSPNQDVAWFDELLDNESLGETRGTGVLIKEEGRWKITQYHLTIPIPNALADSVAKQIKAAQ